MSFTVAIDGPAAAGKGTIARAVAAHFGFAHLDTGLLYRAVGYATLSGTPPLVAAETLDLDGFDEHALRQPDVAQAASRVAALPEVRAALLDLQRAFARRAGGAVLDGRDIGTVICPEAEVKLFVTASAEVRAERRHKELLDRGMAAEYADVLEDVRARDDRDANRSNAPMVAAADAMLLDTSSMSIEDALAAALAAIDAAAPKTQASSLPNI